MLFIGDSPSTGGTFSYDANSLLSHATCEAFVTAAPRLANRDLLTAFQRVLDR